MEVIGRCSTLYIDVQILIKFNIPLKFSLNFTLNVGHFMFVQLKSYVELIYIL